MNLIKVRKAGTKDFPKVFSLVEALLAELGEEGEEANNLSFEVLFAQHKARGDQHVIFVATNPDGEFSGILTLATAFAIYAGGEYGVINEMYVVPEMRSSSIGTRLIAQAVAFGAARGWQRIDVTAPESSRWSRTRAFYEKQGFVFTGPKLKILLPEKNQNGV